MQSDVDGPLQAIVDFLASIWYIVRFGTQSGTPGLPGISLEDGVMVVDREQLVSAGDLLHEAGHLAVMPPARRRAARGRFDASQAVEMMAQAWSYAAARHLGLDPAQVFHEHGYGDGGGGWLVTAFAEGAAIGVPGLCWLGLTSHKIGGEIVPDAVYPTMITWTNETENELR